MAKKTQEQSPEVKALIKAVKVELKPDKRYIIALDNHAVTVEHANQLRLALEGMGIKDVLVAVFDGDPETSMKILEKDKDKGKEDDDG